MTTGVYKITNKKDRKCYVGSSQNIEGRWKKHLSQLNSGNHHNAQLQAAFNQCGETHFRMDILEVCDVADLETREQVFIYKHRPEYNVIVRKAARGNTHPMQQSTKDKIGAYRLGKHHSAETAEKIRSSLMGHATPAETRVKIRDAVKAWWREKKAG